MKRKSIILVLLLTLLVSTVFGFGTIAYADNAEFQLGDFITNESGGGPAFKKVVNVDGGTDIFLGYGWIFDISNNVSSVSSITITGDEKTYTCSQLINYQAARDPLELEFRFGSDWSASDMKAGYLFTIPKGLTIATSSYGTYEVLEDIFYTYDGEKWVAGKAKEALTVIDVNYTSNYAGWAGAAVSVNLGSESGLGDWAQVPKDYISYVDKDGNNVLSYLDCQGNYLNINRAQARVAEVGDVLTLKKGFTWGPYEVKQDIVYVYSTEDQPFVQVKEKPALTVIDVNYTSNYAGFAGAAVSVNLGSESGLGDWAQISKDYISYVDKDGNDVLTYLDSQGNYLIVNRSQARVAAVGDVLTIKKGFTWGEFEAKEDIVYVYTTEGQPFERYIAPQKDALTVVDVNYTPSYAGFAGAAVAVNLGSESGLGDWAQIPTDNISYVDKDGNDVLSFLDSQGNYLIINRGQSRVAEVGDVLTIKKGFTWGNFEAKEDIKYEYTIENQPFVVYAEPLSIVDVNYTEWACGILVNTTDTSNLTWADYAGLDDYIEYVDSNGTPIEVSIVGHQSYVRINYVPSCGDRFTLKAGWKYTDKMLKEDVTYCYATLNQPWVIYDPEVHKVDSVSVESNTGSVRIGSTYQIVASMNEGAIGAIKYYSSDTSILTVDANGLVSGVSEGSASVTCKAGGKEQVVAITVLPQVSIADVVLANSYKIWVVKGEESFLPDNFTAHVLFSDDSYGPEFALTSENATLSSVDTSTVGTKDATITIKYQDVDYVEDIQFEIYEIEEMEIKEVAIVEWFAFNIFVEYPNSSINVANLTNPSLYPDAALYTYARADGTEIICGTYNLGSGNICILPAFNDGTLTLDNFNTEGHFLAGDTITLKAGFGGYFWTGELAPTATDNGAIKENSGMVIKECELKEDVVFKFDGQVWAVFIPYTDITVDSATAEVVVGKTATVGAKRVPIDATEGEFEYVSSDTTVATVNGRGVVTAIKEGTATITITLKGGAAGDKTTTVTVTVVDQIVRLSINLDEITVKQGDEALDLSAIEGKLVYASGKETVVSLADAQVIGFDTKDAGESEVTISLTKDGKTYTASLTVIVEEVKAKKGCKSVVGTMSILGIIGLAFVSIKKRRN